MNENANNYLNRPNLVEGLRLRFRPVIPDDAIYIHQLRTNSEYSMYLSPVNGTVEDQRNWIEKYIVREAKGYEIYYVIERKYDNIACGVVRIYDIRDERFTWGSWILDHNKPAKAALETAFIVYEVGFQQLGKTVATFDVRRDNTHTISFHRRFGAIETGGDEENIYFIYTCERFFEDRNKYLSILKKDSVN